MSKGLPSTWGALEKDKALARELGLRWLPAQERKYLHQHAVEAFSGDDDWTRRGRERIERCTPVALGPARKKRLSRAVTDTAIFFDPARPDALCLSLSSSMSPLCWAEAPATEPGARALFARYFVEEDAPIVKLPRRVRTAGSFGEVTREDVTESLSRHEGLVDDALWYSAHEEDPWLGREENLSALVLGAVLRDVQREHPGRWPSFSVRTLFSRSVIRLEQHAFDHWAVEVHYVPAADPQAVRWVNEVFGARFPEDLPVDVLATRIMLGGNTVGVELDEQEARGELDNFHMLARHILAPGEAEATARTRAWSAQFSDDPEKLRALSEIAIGYGDYAGALEIAARLEGTPVADSLLARLAPERPAPPEEAQGEDDGEDEEDEDDEWRPS